MNKRKDREKGKIIRARSGQGTRDKPSLAESTMRREDVNAAGTSFTHILHPLKFRLSVGDYMEYYFVGEVAGTLRARWLWRACRTRAAPLSADFNLL